MVSKPEETVENISESIATSRPKLKKPGSSKTLNIPTDLNSLKKEVNKPQEVEEESEEVIDPSTLRSKDFQEEDLANAWKEFTQEFEKTGKHQEALILREPFKRDGNKLIVNIPNEALENTFEKFKGGLLTHLRDKLKNDHITISSVVVEIKKEKMRYTDREKFDYLKEKYPALRDLQDRFGLDPEF